jgi:hypothetical protein
MKSPAIGAHLLLHDQHNRLVLEPDNPAVLDVLFLHSYREKLGSKSPNSHPINPDDLSRNFPHGPKAVNSPDGRHS